MTEPPEERGSVAQEPPPQAAPGGDAGPPALGAGEIRRRGRRGELLLTLRAIAMQLIVLGGTVVLARRLAPADFGIYAFATFALSLFSVLGDAGLGAALIQQKERPDQRVLSSIFWLQLLIALAVALAMAVTGTYLHEVWRAMRSLLGTTDAGTGLPPGTGMLFAALALGLVLAVLGAVPSLLMERDLQFGRLSAIEVVGTLAFYLTAVALALLGHGVWALVSGVVARALVVVCAVYALRPWRPSLSFEWHRVKPVLKFGIQFQGKALVSFANAAVTPLYAGAALGTAQLGLVNWSQNTAYFPLKLVEIMNRVTFPTLSRFQDDKEQFANALARAVRICAIGTLFFVGLIFGIGEPLVRIIYSAQWMPAMPYLYVYTAVISIGFLSPLVASALDAIGRPGIIFRLSLGWTALAWAGVVFATPRWGTLGFVVGYCVHVVVGNLAVVYVLRRLVPNARLWPSIRPALVATFLAALTGRLLLLPWIDTVVSLIAGVLALAIVFAAVVLLLDGNARVEAWRLIGRLRRRRADV